MSRSPLNEITRRPQEDAFDEMRIKEEEEREMQIKTLDENYKIKPLNEGDLIKKCINCDNKGYKHMNRHFCSPECAYSHYKLGLDLNPYKPKGGKTKKYKKRTNNKRIKKNKKRTYKKRTYKNKNKE